MIVQSAVDIVLKLIADEKTGPESDSRLPGVASLEAHDMPIACLLKFVDHSSSLFDFLNQAGRVIMK